MKLIFLGSIIVIALILRLEEVFSDLRRPRSLTWGRGRWRLVAWGQVRLSPTTRSLLAVGLALVFLAGGAYGLALLLLALGSVPVFCSLVGGLGILAALWGMRRAWRSGERHRWPERWSEAPSAEVTGLVPRRPAAPPVPSRPGATHGGRPR